MTSRNKRRIKQLGKKKLRRELLRATVRRDEAEHAAVVLHDELDDLRAGLQFWYSVKGEDWTMHDEALQRWVDGRV